MSKLTDFKRSIKEFLAGGRRIHSVQKDRLIDLTQKNAASGYGQLHGFGSIADPVAYRQVPLMSYENVAGFDSYWEDPANFCTERLVAYFLTSGSAGQPKRIPVTASLIREKAEAFGVFWDSIYQTHSKLRTGNFIANFADSGHSRRDKHGVLEVSETTFWNQRMQGFQDPDRWPLGRHLVAIEDSELRYYAAVRLAAQGELHCMMSLNPSTLVKFCQTLEKCATELASGLAAGTWGISELDSDTELPYVLRSRLKRNSSASHRLRIASDTAKSKIQIKAVWPEIELIICWQSGLVEPYSSLLRGYSSGVSYRDYITQSSECAIGIPVSDAQSGGLLAYTSHYFEFIPEDQTEKQNPATLLASELEENHNYEVVVTTGGGLYRYRTADCVRINGFENHIPWLDFQYRFGKTSSITGEKLTEQHVLEALKQSNSGEFLKETDILVFPRTGDHPHYAVMIPVSSVRPGCSTSELAKWLRRLDDALGSVNNEYQDKRQSVRLGRLVGILADDTSFACLNARRREAHVSDEQFKPGILTRERDLDKEVTSAKFINADQQN